MDLHGELCMHLIFISTGGLTSSGFDVGSSLCEPCLCWPVVETFFISKLHLTWALLLVNFLNWAHKSYAGWGREDSLAFVMYGKVLEPISHCKMWKLICPFWFLGDCHVDVQVVSVLLCVCCFTAHLRPFLYYKHMDKPMTNFGKLF